jgi:hypothetical protein
MIVNEMAEVVQILTFILDIPRSNFGFYIKYYDRGFWLFFSVPSDYFLDSALK